MVTHLGRAFVVGGTAEKVFVQTSHHLEQGQGMKKHQRGQPPFFKIVLDGLTEIRISCPLTKPSPAMVADWGLGKPLSTGRLVAGGEFSFYEHSLIC
jgi:hypothetical protein